MIECTVTFYNSATGMFRTDTLQANDIISCVESAVAMCDANEHLQEVKVVW